MDTLRRVQAYASYLPQVETDLHNTLNGKGMFETTTIVADFIMAKLGGEIAEAPKVSRFDKTRRALKKRLPKPPRGGETVEA